jgi:hypothetical protein
MLILFVTEISFAFCFIGNYLTRSQRVTKYGVLCVCLCLYACYRIISFHEQSFGKIIWSVAACIQPIRLRYIEDCLDGKPVRVSGWGSTYES